MGVKVNVKELGEFSERLNALSSEQTAAFMDRAACEMANRLLALVIPRTPVRGGTLRRGWQASAQDMSVARDGAGGHSVTIINPVEYASYVEYGHRQTPGRYVPAIGKRLTKSWVEGQHFLKISEDQLREAAPATLRALLDEFLRAVM